MTVSKLIKKNFPDANVTKLVREGAVWVVYRDIGYYAERIGPAKSPQQSVKRAAFVDVSISKPGTPWRNRHRIRTHDGSIDWWA